MAEWTLAKIEAVGKLIEHTADRIHLSTQARGDRNSSGNADRLEQAEPLQSVCLSLIRSGAANGIVRLSADAALPYKTLKLKAKLVGRVPTELHA
jgi:hypothetical protein